MLTRFGAETLQDVATVLSAPEALNLWNLGVSVEKLTLSQIMFDS